MPRKHVALATSQDETSPLKDKHPLNMKLKFVPFETSHSVKSSLKSLNLKFLQASKTYEKSVT
eukprot:CAMPEP_0194036062 /NCGR_PEP_ID=MMETSP0009_2-20130614/8459_1 /TAXON_ID=210454 /ORGANISM="Grammatophora oceanica, Strain CCMP 410" /LENGTH=62 /DNA_ID=CAMNT_0038677667 /DNA_START=168 /DNA_END=356 /DNA_ORIENTATION=-